MLCCFEGYRVLYMSVRTYTRQQTSWCRQLILTDADRLTQAGAEGGRTHDKTRRSIPRATDSIQQRTEPTPTSTSRTLEMRVLRVRGTTHAQRMHPFSNESCSPCPNMHYRCLLVKQKHKHG